MNILKAPPPPPPQLQLEYGNGLLMAIENVLIAECLNQIVFLEDLLYGLMKSGTVSIVALVYYYQRTCYKVLF